MTAHTQDALDVDDEAVLAAADEIVGGEAARKARRDGLYSLYVIALLATFYGFPFVQAVFRTSDAAWLRTQLFSPLGLLVALALTLAALGSLFALGRVRGPVIPPVPWVDFVLTTPVDRALALRRWWQYAVVGGGGVGAILGLVIGGGLAFAQVTTAWAIAVAVAVCVGIGVLAVRVWLWAQVRSWPGPLRGPSLLWRSQAALRELHAESMRLHSANTSTLAGAALTGNIRAARLQFARPVTRARSVRLRPGRPVTTIVRRDMLGLRRSPARAFAGIGMLATAILAQAATLSEPRSPVVVAVLSLPLAYLGFGTLAEGLRSFADNISTPALLGTSAPATIAAHLGAPTLATLALAGLGLGGTALVGPERVVPVATLFGLLLVLALATTLLATFRGRPKMLTHPQAMLAWYLMPSLLFSVVGIVAVIVTHLWLPVGLQTTCVIIAAMLAVGVYRARAETSSYRE